MKLKLDLRNFIVVFAIIATLTQLGWANITHNSTSSGKTTGGADSLTWSHTVNSGSNIALLVGLSMESGQATGVSYGGAPLTLVGRHTGANLHTIEIWRLLSPSEGSANIIANFDAAREVVGGATAYNEVDQFDPTGSFLGTDGESSKASLTVPSAPGELVLDVLFVDANTITVTADAGQTERWNLANGRRGAGSTEAGAASVVMSWTLSVSEEWSIAGVPIKPSATLPVQLNSFTGRLVNANAVVLEWSTITEVNNYGFYVQRHVDTQTEFTDLHGAFVPGHGTTLMPHDYSWTDQAVSLGTYYYRLKQVDLDGTTHYTDAVQVMVDGPTGVNDEGVPTGFDLSQNYPNPFNPTTTIQFTVERSGPATLTIFNAIGQEIATLFSDNAESGRVYEVQFDATDLANGMYLYKLVSNDQSSINKMVLLK